MNKFHILVVEDEKDISDILKVELEDHGHRVTVIEDGAKAIEYIQDPSTKEIHLCILDRMLPNISGLEICQFLRMFKETKYVSILMLTAMARPEHIVEGLEAGADDYVTKPFDTPVLMARVRNLIKRSQIFQSERDKETGIFEMNKLKVDTHQCKAWIENQELELTLSEYKLLVAFLQSPGKVLTRNPTRPIYTRWPRPCHRTDHRHPHLWSEKKTQRSRSIRRDDPGGRLQGRPQGLKHAPQKKNSIQGPLLAIFSPGLLGDHRHRPHPLSLEFCCGPLFEIFSPLPRAKVSQ